jgi:Tfp pilus assembly protein FimT
MKYKGFSLLETSLILMILSLLTLQSFSFLQDYGSLQEKQSVANFQTLLEIARTAAWEQHTLIQVCPTQDYTRCQEDWHYPLMAYNPKQKKIVATFQAPPLPYQLTYHHFGHSPWFELNPDHQALATNGHWSYCLNQHCYHIVVNRAGHVHVILNTSEFRDTIS